MNIHVVSTCITCIGEKIVVTATCIHLMYPRVEHCWELFVSVYTCSDCRRIQVACPRYLYPATRLERLFRRQGPFHLSCEKQSSAYFYFPSLSLQSPALSAAIAPIPFLFHSLTIFMPFPSSPPSLPSPPSCSFLPLPSFSPAMGFGKLLVGLEIQITSNVRKLKRKFLHQNIASVRECSTRRGIVFFDTDWRQFQVCFCSHYKTQDFCCYENLI